MGAVQNLSAFSDWQNANRRRNRAALLASTHFSRGIQDRNLRSQPCPWVRSKTCPLFRTGRMLTAVGIVLRYWLLRISAAESRTEISAPSPAHGCGPKPVRFFGLAEC